MRSSYDEAQILAYKIQTALKEKKNEMVNSIHKNTEENNNSIERDPLAAASYVYGILQSFDAIEDLVKYIGDTEMADLINEDREFERTMTEWRQLKAIYGKEKDCAKCVHCETMLSCEPCLSCMSCKAEYKPKYKEE